MSDVLIKTLVDGIDTLMTIDQLKVVLDYAPPLPDPAIDENATFADEGESLAGWSITNGTKSQAASRIRNTKTSAAGPGLSSTLSKPVQYPPLGKDFIVYGSLRAKKSAGQFSTAWLLSGSKSLSIWLGSADAATATPGAISIRGITGSTINVLQVASGVDYENEDVVFGLHFDTKYNTVNCYFIKDGQPPEFKGRVACDYFQAPSIQTVTASISSPGNWIEHDYLMVCKPNIIGIGDSIEDGRVGFSADPSLGAINHKSSWRGHANLMPDLRNRIVVDKGIPGNTSAQIASRIYTDAIDHGPKMIIAGCSNNDYASLVSQTARTANVQAVIDAVTGANIRCAIRNGLYGTSAPVIAGAPVTDGSYLAYHKTWWDVYRSGMTGDYTPIDVMPTLKNTSNDYVDPANTGADGVHPNVTGYALIGAAVASELSAAMSH